MYSLFIIGGGSMFYTPVVILNLNGHILSTISCDLISRMTCVETCIPYPSILWFPLPCSLSMPELEIGIKERTRSLIVTMFRSIYITNML